MAAASRRTHLIKGKGLPAKCVALLAVSQKVRPLMLAEVASAQGLSLSQWEELCSRLGEAKALKEIVREPGWQVAASLLSLWAAKPMGKAGNCLDPKEERSREQLEIWLNPSVVG